MMSLYGIASTVVWFGGSTLGVRLNYRIVIIAIILLTIPFALVGNYLVSRKKVKAEKKKDDPKEADEGEADPPAKETKKSAKTSGVDPELEKSGQEAVDFLKDSNIGSAGKDSVYSLPWYVVAGAPKSGKTSLVLSSGLNFQNLPSQRRSEQNLIRPTRNVDWRVTSDAVFVDTAGRFQLDGGGENEWAAVMETIKKFRPKRPIDGFLLTVDTEELLNSNEREIEEKAKVIRARLDQTTKSLKTRFPVYLIFTHADSIEGFRDSFSISKNEGGNLVWGTTIPLEKSDNAQSLFDSEYEILQDSVMKRRLIRLSAPFSPSRQLRIFNFPLHFASARRKLGAFVSTLFRPNPFSESPFLRGFYFTAVPENRSRDGQPNPKPPQVAEKTYFTKKFFREVVLRDRDLVKTFQQQRQKPPILGWAVTILGVLLTTVLLGLSALSLYNNKVMLDDAAAKGDAVLTIVKADANKDPLQKSADDSRREIQAVENLRKVLVDLDKNEREGAPFFMRFGLYSGNRLYKEKLLNIYYNAIEQRYKQPTLRKVVSDLKAFSDSQTSASAENLPSDVEEELDKKYNLLKVYLMWSEEYKTRSEPTSFTTALEETWVSESKLPAELKDISIAQMEFYFKQVDRESQYSGDSSGFPRIKLDENVVNQSRAKLRAFPSYLRYLNRVTTEVSKEVGAVTVDSILAGRDPGTLSGSHTIPGAYTIDGYRNFMKEKIANADKELSEDDWVMGEKAGDISTQATEIANLEKKYFREYTDNWRELVRSTKVNSFDRKQELMERTLSAFSDSDSPMKILLEEIARNTNLSAQPEPAGWIEWIKSFFSKGAKTDTGGDTDVEKDFSPLFDFVGSGQEPSDKVLPVENYGSTIKELAEDIVGASANQIRIISKQIETEDEKGTVYRKLKRVNGSIESLLKNFKTPAGQELSRLLKEPIDEVQEFFGGDADTRRRKKWSQEILPMAKEIENGYPFSDDGEADLTKLKAFLNPVDGALTKFYTGYLEKSFEEKDGALVVKEGGDKFSPEFVKYLNDAFKLRKALFGENASPNFEYDFQLLPVSEAIIEVTIDGQKVTSEGTASVKLKFPAASGQETGVSMNVSSTSETNSTSGNPVSPGGSANNSNSNVSQPNPVSPVPLSQFLQDSNAALKFPGSWGLFKFFDAGSPSKQPGGEYILTYSVGGKTVKASVKPTGGDLFDRSTFRSVKAPENISQ